MLCGVELQANISEEKAEALSNEFNLSVDSGYATGKERNFADNPNSYLRQAEYRHLIVQVRRKGDQYTLITRGSLHKFYHDHNRGQFLGSEVIKAIEGICMVFGIDSDDFKINNLEVGANVPTWFKDIYPYLKSNLVQHRKKAPEEPKELKRKGYHFTHEDYFIKLYAKGEYLLRFEIKYTSIKKLRGFGITTLAHLTPVAINRMVDTLLVEWQQIITRDAVNILEEKNRAGDGLPEQDRIKLLEFTSNMYLQSYYEKLKEATCKRKKESLRQQSYRLKVDCMRLIRDFGNGDHSQLYSFIVELADRFKSSLMETENVTDSANDKKGENVTRDKENLNKILIYNMNTEKGIELTPVKKVLSKEIREKADEVNRSFINLLDNTGKQAA